MKRNDYLTVGYTLVVLSYAFFFRNLYLLAYLCSLLSLGLTLYGLRRRLKLSFPGWALLLPILTVILTYLRIIELKLGILTILSVLIAGVSTNYRVKRVSGLLNLMVISGCFIGILAIILALLIKRDLALYLVSFSGLVIPESICLFQITQGSKVKILERGH